jgi:hypothetical protein
MGYTMWTYTCYISLSDSTRPSTASQTNQSHLTQHLTTTSTRTHTPTMSLAGNRTLDILSKAEKGKCEWTTPVLG